MSMMVGYLDFVSSCAFGSQSVPVRLPPPWMVSPLPSESCRKSRRWCGQCRCHCCYEIGRDSNQQPQWEHQCCGGTHRSLQVVPQQSAISELITSAVMMAVARNVAEGCASLKAGKWERSRLVGVEAKGKTLAIVGLGKGTAEEQSA